MEGNHNWIEVDLDAIANNVKLLKGLVNPSKLLVVVKADGYGHGILEIARTAIENGADWLGAFGVDECIQLRKGGISSPILNIAEVLPERMDDVLMHDITQTVFTRNCGRGLSKRAVDMNREVKVHIKVDTGLARVGAPYTVAEDFICEMEELPGLEVEGIYSTLSEVGREESESQYASMVGLRDNLRGRGVMLKYTHLVSSAGLSNKQMYLDMVRCGITVYGINPDNGLELEGLRPALAFKTKVAYVKDLQENERIGYGGSYATPKAMRVATVSAGYYDGLNRLLSNKGRVLIHGLSAPILGRVSTNHCIVDVTEIPDVHVGDEATIIGSQGEAVIGVEEFSELADSSPYEVFCKLGQHIKRYYFKNGKVRASRTAIAKYEEKD